MTPTAFLLWLALASSALAKSRELDELKAAMRAMQKTIAEQNARIATLEKQQRTPKPAPTETTYRSVTVGGMTVPLAE